MSFDVSKVASQPSLFIPVQLCDVTTDEPTMVH